MQLDRYQRGRHGGSGVWRPHRTVEASGVSMGTLDVEVSVQKPRDDPLEFEIVVYNLSEASWSRIGDGQSTRIRLGWEGDEIQTVVVGEIDSTSREPDAGDVRFRIAGIDETEKALRQYPDEGMHWTNPNPGRAASDIARAVGLTPRTQNAPEPISGSWNVRTDRKWYEWLDDLLEHAEELSGEEWQWYGERGQLAFEPRQETSTNVPMLSYDGMALSVSPKTNPDDDVDGQLEFEALLDPRIRKGAIVAVDAGQIHGAYRVAEYEFDSSTIDGDHYVRGTLDPLDENYTIGQRF